jgi:hypothetical protein
MNNPHRPGSALHNAWQQGWHAGQAPSLVRSPHASGERLSAYYAGMQAAQVLRQAASAARRAAGGEP